MLLNEMSLINESWDWNRFEFEDSHFTFTDKESYLQWVKEWQTIYKELSFVIRILKASYKLPHNRPEWCQAHDIDSLAIGYKQKYGFMTQGGYFCDGSAGHNSSTQKLAAMLLDLRARGRVLSQEMKKALLVN